MNLPRGWTLEKVLNSEGHWALFGPRAGRQGTLKIIIEEVGGLVPYRARLSVFVNRSPKKEWHSFTTLDEACVTMMTRLRLHLDDDNQ